MIAGRFDSEFHSAFEHVCEQLCCPACHGELRLEAEYLVCAGCGRVYPVVDGIPVLIAEEPGTRD